MMTPCVKPDELWSKHDRGAWQYGNEGRIIVGYQNGDGVIRFVPDRTTGRRYRRDGAAVGAAVPFPEGR
jgi:hypothetical protein